MAIPSEDELTEAIYQALRAAVGELRATYPDQHFYYFSLITTGDAAAPGLAVSSKETLASLVKDAGGGPVAERELKWSYADSPFYPFGENHFDRVRELFASRPQPDFSDAASWQREYDLRLRAMERAISRLDAEGTFGHGDERDQIVLNVEVMPPDVTNVARAKRLNPPSAIKDWLVEAGES